MIAAVFVGITAGLLYVAARCFDRAQFYIGTAFALGAMCTTVAAILVWASA